MSTREYVEEPLKVVIEFVESLHDAIVNRIQKNLTNLEESVIVDHVLDLDSHGFLPSYDAVRDMADNLLGSRSTRCIGIKWPQNLIKRTSELKTWFQRRYDYQRALCKDPDI